MLINKNKNFFLLWQGQLVSQVGSKIYLIALAWYFVSVLDDNHAFITIMLISSLPGLLFGLLIGPFIDRWNKKYILVISDLLSGLIVLVIALLIWFKVDNSVFIYSAVFILNISITFFNPAVTSLIPSLVKKDQIQEGISLNTMVQFIAQFIGCALGGMLVAFLGIFTTILLNAISYLLSAFSEMFIKYKHYPAPVKLNHFHELAEGFRYVLKNPSIFRPMVVFSLLNIFAVPIIVFIPILVDDFFKLSAVYYGFAESGIPVGAILIALILAKKQVSNHLKLIKSGLILISTSFFLIYLFRDIYLVMAALLGFGLFLNLININAISFYAKNIEVDFRGRFFTLLNTISFATFPLAYLLTGILLKQFSLFTLILINGLAMLVIGLGSIVYLRKPTHTPLKY
jgi:MFS transporter, DHA3 family, macrolide efflux protein